MGGNQSRSGFHWGVLEPDLGDSRTTRDAPVLGECPPHEERTRTAHRLARVPMVTVPALGGITAGCISAGAGGLPRAHPTAAPERIGPPGLPPRTPAPQVTSPTDSPHPHSLQH